MLREIVRTDLQAQGYTVYTASDGEEGIQLYRDQRDDIALVILDLGLPRVSGEQVLLRLKEINPDVRVMVATGYLDPDAMLGLMKAGAREFVQKPYQSAEILRKIRHVLDHGGVGSETQGTMNDDDSQV
jgi:DNA-binding response OmpR family regulator